jgi:8-oxo-dGTP pyrophosphatase MutT (NUDIX family)
MSGDILGENCASIDEQRCAGGVVLCRDIHGLPLVLLICVDRGDGRIEWVLPKGHVEPGESPEEAARREIEEETGLDTGSLISLDTLGDLSYSFHSFNSKIDKSVTFFVFAIADDACKLYSRLPLLVGSYAACDGIIETGFFGIDFARERVSFDNYVSIIEKAVAIFESSTAQCFVTAG